MNLAIKRTAFAKPLLAAAMAIVGWIPAHSFADDASYSVYRCWQGDTSQCKDSARDADVRVEKRLVLGPHALYLAHLGDSQEHAALKAQALGEHAVERTVRITKHELSPAHRYQRFIDGLTTSNHSEETLSEVAVDARALRIAGLR
jgi:hypothetical protein